MIMKLLKGSKLHRCIYLYEMYTIKFLKSFQFIFSKKVASVVLAVCTILQSIFGISTCVEAESIEKAAAVNTWDTTSVPNMPTTRSEFGAVEVDGKFYCIGGYDGNSYLSVVEVYNPATNSWETKKPMPTPRRYLEVVAYGSKIYCMGGNGQSGSTLKVVEIYDINSDTWSTGTPMTIARYSFGIAIVDGKIYCAGGHSGSSYLDSLDVYDISTNSWSTKANIGYSANGLSLIPSNNKLYLIGGFNNNGGSNSTYYSKVQEYDISANTWTTRKSMRTSRGFFAAINVDEIIYCIGGSDGSVISTVEAYDTLNNSWSTKTSIPKKVRNAGIFTLNGKIYCIGGKIDNSDSESDKRNTVSVYTAKIVSDEEVAEYYVELAEKYQTEEYIQYALSFTEILSESTKKSELIRRIEILIYEPESKNISNDVFIIPDNILEVSSNINSIIFDNFSVLESCEKLSVLELTVSSSLPYNIKSSIESDIFGSNSGNKIDKSILSIKTSKDNTYKDFSESITVLTLAENQSIGENIKHTIDIRLNAGKIKKMDIYKTILKFEIEQL